MGRERQKTGVVIGRRALLAGVALLLLQPAAVSAHAAGDAFVRFLADVAAQARRRGVPAGVVERAFAGLRPIARVVELDRHQPERRIRFTAYRARILSPERIAHGVQALLTHRQLLRDIEARYGVPAQMLVALWGIESAYGRITGDFPVIGALATLAFEGRRARFFRGELLAALEILARGDVELERMRGSWAGAMGQPQFMPTTYLRYAVDADGDGRADIWDSLPDVFASMARYLRAAGWKPGWRWGRELAPVPPHVAPLAGLERRDPLHLWQRRGLRLVDGRPLPHAEIDAALVLPDGPPAPAFLAYHNFRVLMRWNRSTYFAAAAGLLADAVAAGAAEA